MNDYESGPEVRWSDVEKKVARRAFDLGCERECRTIAAKVKKLMAQNANPRAIWAIEDYLFEQRRKFDEKYDYRYSVLISVFGRLLAERWLSVDDLAGLRDEKIERIEKFASFRNRRDPSAGRATNGPREDHPLA